MVHFFIESKNEFTPEYVFLDKYIKRIRPNLDYDIIPMDGIGFSDYENCMKSQKGTDGKPIYQVPNLKGKLHTYITAVPMPQKMRKTLGKGNWQFENEEYWNLDSPALNPLKAFLQQI